jgi:transposase
MLADVGDIHRFATRDRFASWNGTAPLDVSSGQEQRHRLSRAGNRRINRTLHIMAIPRQPVSGSQLWSGPESSSRIQVTQTRQRDRGSGRWSSRLGNDTVRTLAQ